MECSLAWRIVRQYLKCQGIIRITNGPPKGHRGFVCHQYVNRKPLCLWPQLRPKNIDRFSAESTPPLGRDDEKLPQVNLLRILSKQRIRHDLAASLKHDSAILQSKAIPSFAVQFGHRHPIAVSFIAN